MTACTAVDRPQVGSSACSRAIAGGRMPTAETSPAREGRSHGRRGRRRVRGGQGTRFGRQCTCPPAPAGAAAAPAAHDLRPGSCHRPVSRACGIRTGRRGAWRGGAARSWKAAGMRTGAAHGRRGPGRHRGPRCSRPRAERQGGGRARAAASAGTATTGDACMAGEVGEGPSACGPAGTRLRFPSDPWVYRRRAAPHPGHINGQGDGKEPLWPFPPAGT